MTAFRGIFTGVLLLVCAAARAQTDVLTFHNDNFRTGANVTEQVLTPANVNSSSFGKLFSVPMDGKVDAQPLVVSALAMPDARNPGTRNVVFAATEHDSVYAFDADSGAIYWTATLLKSGETPSDPRSCSQVIPEIGVTATPVIDRGAGPNGAIYLVAMSKDATGAYYHRLHALDLLIGAELFGGPVDIAATYPGSGANSSNGQVIFDPKQYKDRAGLLLLNGVVYTSWGSHCDISPYTGWTIGYDENTLKQTAVFNFAPNGGDAAIWNSGGAPAADQEGNLYFSVANGTFDAELAANGFPKMGDYGNSLVKLSLVNGQLTAADYWTMDNSNQESSVDQDLGSGGLMLIPGTRLLVGAGKDTSLYVADRDNMGKFDSVSNATIHQVLTGALPGGVWSSPAYFGNQVYYNATGDYLRAFAVANDSLSPASISSAPLRGYPGSTPAVSANGTAAGIVWAVENAPSAVLHAYDASDLTHELYNSNEAGASRDQFGPPNKFISPTIANGKVFAGTTNGVAVFGLLAPQTVANGTYSVTRSGGRRTLTAENSGSRVRELVASGSVAQKWIFIANASGTYTIQNQMSGLYLTDSGFRTKRADILFQTTANLGESQLWKVSATGPGFTIVNQATGLAIESADFTEVPGGLVFLGVPRNGGDQIWTIQERAVSVK